MLCGRARASWETEWAVSQASASCQGGEGEEGGEKTEEGKGRSVGVEGGRGGWKRWMDADGKARKRGDPPLLPRPAAPPSLAHPLGPAPVIALLQVGVCALRSALCPGAVGSHTYAHSALDLTAPAFSPSGPPREHRASRRDRVSPLRLHKTATLLGTPLPPAPASPPATAYSRSSPAPLLNDYLTPSSPSPSSTPTPTPSTPSNPPDQ
ncbi:hypothetical protein CALCODRAFT_163708 [Calocera cornea HHB12733]|uniref:Uncharacterized protein n=1 Tax=Calocera cornea HHB12733 TaxID=1353952 RepID=A0A165CJJ1_9BASI|nr:hypothetical protein CALCODRAFT_163708 [Calocera cornea HHB12733]